MFVLGRIEGVVGVDDVVILGAHEDSINRQSANIPEARAPGADDDGKCVDFVDVIPRISWLS